MSQELPLSQWLKMQTHRFGPIVRPGSGEHFAKLDLSESNERLGELRGADPDQLARFVESEIHRQGARYAVGGYGEDRAIYQKSALFGSGKGARTVHLGVDLWMPAGTEVLAPARAVIHSFADNRSPGDYGPTILLRHEIEGRVFHTLYGHLSRKSLLGLRAGDGVEQGGVVATLGSSDENGGWPAHLHFQIVEDLEGKKGDFPGVAARDEWVRLSMNCPDPGPILKSLPMA